MVVSSSCHHISFYTPFPFPPFSILLLFSVYVKGLSSHFVLGQNEKCSVKRKRGRDWRERYLLGKYSSWKISRPAIPTGTFLSLDTTLWFLLSSERKKDRCSIFLLSNFTPLPVQDLWRFPSGQIRPPKSLNFFFQASCQTEQKRSGAACARSLKNYRPVLPECTMTALPRAESPCICICVDCFEHGRMALHHWNVFSNSIRSSSVPFTRLVRHVLSGCVTNISISICADQVPSTDKAWCSQKQWAHWEETAHKHTHGRYEKSCRIVLNWLTGDYRRVTLSGVSQHWSDGPQIQSLIGRNYFLLKEQMKVTVCSTAQQENRLW